jgi:3-phenylpropionate/trans-cinnamate dioxygenase ferredoxin reductase subunit
MKTITIVGTALAGFSAAQQLRAQGFDGHLIMVGEEIHQPYDRPPLSKEFLTGGLNRAGLALGTQPDFDELRADWILGDPATGIDRLGGRVELCSGTTIATDGIVIATGASARNLPHAAGITGVHTLRTVDDATALRDHLTTGSPRVVVIGAGFIGSEVASSCRSLGLDVTVVEAADLPLVPVLGPSAARACAQLHRDNGAAVRFGCGVEEIRASSSRVTAVRLTNGAEIPADVVVVGIGASPNSGWLNDTGLTLADGVCCDEGGVTELSNIIAVGDVCRIHRPSGSVRAEHWSAASDQPDVAVHNLLAGNTVRHHTDIPYFWSDQYGVHIQFAGHTLPGDDLRIVEGSIAERSFLAYYERGGYPVGLLAFNQPRGFGRARRQLARNRPAGAAL